MCYYVASKLSREEIFQLEHDFVVSWEESEIEDYYMVPGFAHPALPVITESHEFMKMRWGLIPAWVKDWKGAVTLRVQTLNAQSETIDSKPSFRGAVKSGHFCIIPLNGYFEWHHHANKNKIPFFIYPKHASLFYVAGLHESWTNPESGESWRTFTMLTTAANGRCAYIHNSKQRMPALLSLGNARMWLDPAISFDQKKSMLMPYDEEEMLDHSISKLITSRKENPNQPAVTEPFVYPELDGPF